MTQKEWFKTLNTDHLLSMRRQTYCQYPKNEGDKAISIECEEVFDLSKTLLKEELATRPHRIRAKDRRKVKRNK